MRVAVLFFSLAVLSGVGLLQPSPTNAANEPKVVIIVGPTEGSTDNYRKSADEAYQEAIKHTPNVVKVYSPNATWSKVMSVTKGASIVVYLGHGNGCPSPYSCSAPYTTKNGFGLNKAAGNGDSNNKYYGEPYVSTLDLAPNAVIILNRLCYASGNSEPGKAAPSQADARKRVDNFGAGFLKAGAAAVIADGHGGAGSYIRNLFTMNGTVLDVWRANPNYHDHEQAFDSTRTPGAKAYTDTEKATSGYYRSLVTRPSVTTSMVMGKTATPDPYPGTPFTDIAGNTFAKDIAWLFDSKITAGCSPDTYCPNATVTRGQMASFLARALRLPAASEDYFDDDDGTTHEVDINRIAAASIPNECGPGRYCPNAVMTRAEMASFLANGRGLPASDADTFTDDDGSPYEPDIERIAAVRLTSGCSATTYCPNDSVTRGQMAAFLHRAFGD